MQGVDVMEETLTEHQSIEDEIHNLQEAIDSLGKDPECDLIPVKTFVTTVTYAIEMVIPIDEITLEIEDITDKDETSVEQGQIPIEETESNCL